MLSPLFPHTYADKTASIRVVYNETSRKIDVIVDRVLASDTAPIENVEAAEEAVFGLAEDEYTVTPAGAETTINILRAANTIAARTRRGAGNVAFMHPSTLAIVAEDSGYAKDRGEKVGRWTHAGKLNNTINVYVSDSMTEDEVVVAYANSKELSCDAPAALFERDGAFSLYVLPSTESTLGNAADYVQRIKIAA